MKKVDFVFGKQLTK